MSGHSHWATIKRKKGAIDAKRGKAFSKLTKAIMQAAKQGGGNPDMNLRLQYAIEKGKQANLPKDNIERAIKKATGEFESVNFEEFNYEGYGPGGAAIIMEILTDNRNRTASETRKIFDKAGGNLGETGCVSWMFEKKGVIVVDHDSINEDDLMTLVLDAGAEDMEKVEDTYQITCALSDFEPVKKILKDKNIDCNEAELSLIPTNSIELNEKDGQKMIGLMETLENHDDIQNVYSNFTLNEEQLAEMQNE
ncbi:MAG: YebC/PmpR family DNA-binding transcriptional regulator [Candidatus Anammoxibacter sp.]